MIHFKDLQYGFEYGSARIVRHFTHDNGAVTIGLETPKHSGNQALQIYITKTGKVRVFSPDAGEWIKPDKTNG